MTIEIEKLLPKNWTVVSSSTHPGRFFFFNEVTRASSWEFPEEKEKKRPEKIRCSHILIKHTGVRNPVSKRTKKAVTFSKEEALAHIKKLHAALKKDYSLFEEIAKQESDDASFKRGGDLNFFVEKTMQPSFAKPAFALEVGQMSGIIESSSGLHIILRTA